MNKKGMEMWELVMMIIMIILLLVVIFWYAGLDQVIAGLLDKVVGV